MCLTATAAAGSATFGTSLHWRWIILGDVTRHDEGSKVTARDERLRTIASAEAPRLRRDYLYREDDTQCDDPRGYTLRSRRRKRVRIYPNERTDTQRARRNPASRGFTLTSIACIHHSYKYLIKRRFAHIRASSASFSLSLSFPAAARCASFQCCRRAEGSYGNPWKAMHAVYTDTESRTDVALFSRILKGTDKTSRPLSLVRLLSLLKRGR